MAFHITSLLNILLCFFFAGLLTQATASALAEGTEFPAYPARTPSDSTIAALLHSSSSWSLGIFARQAGTCETGYVACSDGKGCCPSGEECGTWGGALGCCPAGGSCATSGNKCDYKGDVLCVGETFCCPDGSSCSRDSKGTPMCKAGKGAGTSKLGGARATAGPMDTVLVSSCVVVSVMFSVLHPLL
ncbi:hypothetical protein BD779DRAFT_1562667 [Infundibulicybe gibba]|nr:hypothetical protein BD779DRAFT_1562667 [Infundibulicybe gibba]